MRTYRSSYRAAYLPAIPGSNGAGFALTSLEHAHLSDAELIKAARQSLAEYNYAAASLGITGADCANIVIGRWITRTVLGEGGDAL